MQASSAGVPLAVVCGGVSQRTMTLCSNWTRQSLIPSIFLFLQGAKSFTSLVVPNQPSSATSSSDAESSSWITISPGRAFVQPGVVQHFRKPIAMPESPVLVEIWGESNYRIALGPVTKFLVRLVAVSPRDLSQQEGVAIHSARAACSPVLRRRARNW